MSHRSESSKSDELGVEEAWGLQGAKTNVRVSTPKDGEAEDYSISVVASSIPPAGAESAQGVNVLQPPQSPMVTRESHREIEICFW